MVINMKAGKTEYLQMIQEPISRMSTISAIFKGFAATIVAGIATISYCEIHIVILALSFLPVVAFAILDIYYLILERKFRFLFNQVRLDKHEIDFSMELAISSEEVALAKARVRDCIMSPSILVFYAPMVCILALVFALKLIGIQL